jgi:hypothetical protein
MRPQAAATFGFLRIRSTNNKTASGLKSTSPSSANTNVF